MDLKKLRTLILVVIAIIGLVLSGLFAKNLVDNKVAAVAPAKKIVKEVAVQKVTNSDVKVTIPAQGLLKAKQRIEIYAEVQGVFTTGKKLFRTGQSYQSNETLLQLDAAEYFSNVKASRNNLHNQIAAALPDIRLDYPKEYSKWAAFLRAINVNQNLTTLPPMEEDGIRLFISGRGILSAYYSVKNLEQRLSKYTITAPFEGVLTEALVTEGTLVRSGQKLGSFIKPGVYELTVSIPKSYSDKLSTGASVVLSSLDETATYLGVISRINASVDPSTQTTAVMIEIKDSSLSDGVYLKANITGDDIENSVSLPRGLLSQEFTIFKVQDNTLISISVVPMHFSEDEVVVRGIPNGTTILAKPLLGAYEGMLVNPSK
jgi:membrane fusion protein (multidrug efflux system)